MCFVSMATIKVTHVGSDLASKSKKLSFVGRVTAARWHPRRSSNHVQPPLRPLRWADERLTFMWISDDEKCERLSGRQAEDEQVFTEVVESCTNSLRFDGFRIWRTLGPQAPRTGLRWTHPLPHPWWWMSLSLNRCWAEAAAHLERGF